MNTYCFHKVVFTITLLHRFLLQINLVSTIVGYFVIDLWSYLTFMVNK